MWPGGYTRTLKDIAEEKFTKSVFWMTDGVLYFLSTFARNAKYCIIISGHLPFLTLKSGTDLLNDNHSLSLMTLGCCTSTGMRSLWSQKAPASQNFWHLPKIHCLNDRLEFSDPPRAKDSPCLSTSWTFQKSVAVSVCLVPMKVTCTVLILSSAFPCLPP